MALLFLPASFAQKSSQSPGKHRHLRVAEPAPDEALAREIAGAEKALDQNDFARAEDLLRQASARKSDDAGLNAQLWFDLGLVYKAENKVADAIEAYRKAVAFAPGIFESNLNLGLLLAGDGRAQEAAPVLRKATTLTPSPKNRHGLADAWFALGHVLEATEPRNAVAAFARASELQPANPQPHLLSAALHEQMKNYSSAQLEYQAALKIDPGSIEALSGLAHLYSLSGRYPEAATLLQQYIAANPADARAYAQLALVLAEQKRIDEAGQAMSKALELAPDDSGILKNAARFYAETNNYSRAEALYPRLEKIDPKNAELHRVWGEMELKQRKFPEAIGQLAIALQINPTQLPVYEKLAYALAEVKNYPATMRVLDARARLSPDSPATLFLRATTLDHLRQPKLAAEAYRQFLADAKGRFPDQEWQAQQRIKALDPHEK